MTALAAETTAANGTDFVSWRHCEVHTRSTFNILSLCLSTLVICVWNAVHPDVPDPDLPRWRVALMRLNGFIVGLLFPEVLVLTALNQFVDARQLLQDMNGTQSESLFTMSYWTKLLKDLYPRAFTISYWTEAWRPDVWKASERPQWTMTHAFYAVMGGFVSRSHSGRHTYLSTTEIITLCKVDGVRPLFAAYGLDDHSKAGALAKALFCWQLLVFAISCIARRAELLPLSLLEITTLAHSLCGLAAFALWWHKPHSVDEAVVIPVDGASEKKIEWTGMARLEFAALVGLTMIMPGPGERRARKNLAGSVGSSLTVAALYGLPHLLALSTEFPTLAERRCWQAATAIIISAPVILVALCWVSDRAEEGALLSLTVVIGLVVLPVMYLIASCFIAAESFRQLSALPSGAFLSPALICYLPHFS